VRRLKEFERRKTTEYERKGLALSYGGAKNLRIEEVSTELTDFSLSRLILGIPGYGRWMKKIECIASYSYFDFG